MNNDGFEHGRFDWLYYAVATLGGRRSTAAKVGISPRTVKRWLDQGLGAARFADVVKLAKLSGLMVENLVDAVTPLTPQERAAEQRRHRAWAQRRERDAA